MNEWQPIETAPKDGSSILICTFDDEFGDVEMHVGEWFDFGKYWTTSCGGCIHDETHWMPLPKPPLG